MGGTETVWEAHGEAWAYLHPPRESLRSYGAGETPVGEMEIEMHPYVRVRERDVLEVSGGPEAGSRWRVVALHHAGGRRTVARTERYAGELETAA